MILNKLDLDLDKRTRARMNMLLGELRRRNRDFLAMHVRFMEQNDDLLSIVADAVDKKQMKSTWDPLDLVRCAVASYAYVDLHEGAEKFAELMASNTTWDDKVNTIRRAFHEPHTEQ